MEKVRIDEIENSIQPAAVMRHLTEPLGLTDLAIHYYELEPGDSFAFAYHSHEIQEEVFYVQEGTATFETEDGSVEVEAGEILRFGREEFQRGWNWGDDGVRALALDHPSSTGTSRNDGTVLTVRWRPTHDWTEPRTGRRSSHTVGSVAPKPAGGTRGRWTERSPDTDGVLPLWSRRTETRRLTTNRFRLCRASRRTPVRHRTRTRRPCSASDGRGSCQ